MAGLGAMDLVFPWSDRSDDVRGLTDAGAVCVTLLTGGQLLAVSLAAGLSLRVVARPSNGRWR